MVKNVLAPGPAGLDINGHADGRGQASGLQRAEQRLVDSGWGVAADTKTGIGHGSSGKWHVHSLQPEGVKAALSAGCARKSPALRSGKIRSRRHVAERSISGGVLVFLRFPPDHDLAANRLDIDADAPLDEVLHRSKACV